MKKILLVAAIIGLTSSFGSTVKAEIDLGGLADDVACKAAKGALKTGCQMAITKAKNDHKDRVRTYKSTKATCSEAAKRKMTDAIATVNGNTALTKDAKKAQIATIKSTYKSIDKPKCKADFAADKETSTATKNNVVSGIKNTACATLKSAAQSACRKVKNNN